MLTDALAFDTETHLAQDGLSAPPLVCASIAWWNQGQVIGKILDKEQAKVAFYTALQNPTITFIMAQAVYDMLVMASEFAKDGRDILPDIFAAYEAGRVFDTLLVEQLHHIAIGMLGYDPRTKRQLRDPDTGKQGKYYKLAVVHDLVHGDTGAKANDRFRKSYALLEHIPIEHWPPEAKQYPVDDAVNTAKDGFAQAGLIPNTGMHNFVNGVCSRCTKRLTAGIDPRCISAWPRENIHDAALQAYTHWCMALGAAWGLTPDPVAVAKLKYEAAKDLEEEQKPFIEAGIVRANGSVNESVLKKFIAEAYGSKNPCQACTKTVHPAGRDKGKPAPGKMPSLTTNGRTLVNCEKCWGTGLELTASVPRSESGDISKGRDPCSESGHELLMSWAGWNEDAKILTSYVPFLEEGIVPDYRLVIPEGATRAQVDEALNKCLHDIERAMAMGWRIVIPITLSPNVLLETNRASYRGVIQLLPRNGGVRECFIARPGCVYYSNDYGGLELAAWSQIIIWMGIDSQMAKAINSGTDVHAKLGARMAGTTIEDLLARIKMGDKQAKEYRGAAKWANFGFMADMGPIRLVQQVRMQGQDTPHPTGPIVKNGKRVYRGQRFCLLIGNRPRCGERMLTEWNREPIAPTCEECVKCAKWLKEQWRETWTEEKQFFKNVKRIADQGWQRHPISKRIRGGIGYSDGANGYFQELAAQGAKDALRHVVREQYDHTYRPDDLHGERSLLYGTSRTIVFAHDELIGEALFNLAPEIAERVSATMDRRMKVYIPDVKVKAEPTIMTRWYKQAACVRDENGRLQLWTPKAA